MSEIKYIPGVIKTEIVQVSSPKIQLELSVLEFKILLACLGNSTGYKGYYLFKQMKKIADENGIRDYSFSHSTDEIE